MKVLITVQDDFIAPRFDLCPEVIIAAYYDQQLLEEPHSIIISRVTAESICNLATKEHVQTVICCGIEEQHYQYLKWKKIRVIDSVIGSVTDTLEALLDNKLLPGTILSLNSTREKRR